MSEDKFLRKVKYLINLSTVSIVAAILVLPLYLLAPKIFKPNKQTENSSNLLVKVEIDENRIENGIHVSTGFVEAEGLMTVVRNCTSCHSSKLILQNRMNREGWNTTIKWMQETQNLWDLGENQEVIVNYLVTNYPLEKKGRRENLKNIDWYEIED